MGQLGATADRGDGNTVDTGKAKNPGKTVQKFGSSYKEVDIGKTVSPPASSLGSKKSVIGKVKEQTENMGKYAEE